MSKEINQLTAAVQPIAPANAFHLLQGANSRQLSLRELFHGFVVNGLNKNIFPTFEDFTIGFNPTTGEPIGTFLQDFAGAGAGLTNFPVVLGNRPGVVQFNTGTTTTGRAAIRTSLDAWLLGNNNTLWEFEVAVNFPALSTAGQEYDFRIGFGDSVTADFTDGVYFEYDRNSSLNWNIVTASNSVRTRTATAIAVAAATWFTLRAVINSLGTSVDFFINNALVGTTPTNIPIGAGRQVGILGAMIKSAGTTSVTALLDYIGIWGETTDAR